eukprot:CAMPEP_0185040182 /NCGR_PEP_ID=MMETSP1103-20130426/37941_1 /TAXON_ID=36769 /ORGANISM="Paraphysomonas bandaiensis, Strain Caron Lab Isolate" /LENGTH=500 /DNA_ID=CAMNT_0027579375 /DNA_START=133 /DNA_END=1635 /DNA_ORIENTATION=+
MNSNNTKPSHRGRLIKDNKHVLSLEPMRKGPQPPMSKRGFSVDMMADGSGCLNMEGLKRRVRDLEAENSKLQRKIDEADLALKNYRSFLSSKSSTSNVCVATQTDITPGSYSRVNTQDSGPCLLSPRNDDSNEKDKLKSEISTLRSKLADATDKLATAKKEQMHIENTKNARILELENELQAIVRAKKSINDDKRMDTLGISREQATALQSGIKSVCSTASVVAKEVPNELGQFRDYMLDSLKSILERIQAQENQRAISSPSKSGRAGDILRVSGVDQGCDPLSPMINRQMAKADFEAAQKLKDQQLSDMMRTLQRVTEQCEQEKLMIEAKAKQDSHRAALLSERVTSASRELHAMVQKFSSEINAVKHLSHCRDLVRVAGLRELGLERDRLANELRYARDLQNVIWFCLETAEQTLGDTHPHVVSKLTESRSKRVAALEREALERKKDLEQRSSETCAVSTSHLETFQTKAEIKCKKAAEESQAVLLSLQKLLTQRDDS